MTEDAVDHVSEVAAASIATLHFPFSSILAQYTHTHTNSFFSAQQIIVVI